MEELKILLQALLSDETLPTVLPTVANWNPLNPEEIPLVNQIAQALGDVLFTEERQPNIALGLEIERLFPGVEIEICSPPWVTPSFFYTPKGKILFICSK